MYLPYNFFNTETQKHREKKKALCLCATLLFDHDFPAVLDVDAFLKRVQRYASHISTI